VGELFRIVNTVQAGHAVPGVLGEAFVETAPGLPNVVAEKAVLEWDGPQVHSPALCLWTSEECVLSLPNPAVGTVKMYLHVKRASCHVTVTYGIIEEGFTANTHVFSAKGHKKESRRAESNR